MTSAAPLIGTTQKPESLIERLNYYAEIIPDHDAVVTTTLTLSYAQLAQLVRSQANALSDAGLSENSVIGIKCADEIQHLLLCLAVMDIGATSCTIPTHEAEQVQNAIISRCGTTHILDEGNALSSLVLENGPGLHNTGSIVEHAREAQLLFSTSGTTGEPKLVVHRDRDILAQAHRHVSSEQERFACLASIEHNFAKRHRLYCVAAGATNIFLGAERESLVAQSQALKMNVLHVSAFQAQELLATPNIHKLSNIRLKLGGSHAPLSLRHQLRDSITQNLQAGYGTTETGAIAFTDPKDKDAGESVGKPLPGIEVRAVSPERKPVDIGKRGELAIRCEGTFRGYHGNPDLTAARLENGWFYTGDIGYLDSQQRIHLCGRSDDMFVFNSMNIFPQDIESEILKYPGIIDVAVLPKASSVHGNIPVALVVFSKDVKQRLPALKKFVQKRVGVRSPRQYFIVDKIPTNASGKTSRYEAMNLTTKSDKIRSDVINLLDTRITRRVKGSMISAFEKGDLDILLREFEMDSLERMEFLVAIEINYDVVITPRELGKFRYLGNVVSRILSPIPQHELEPDHTNFTTSALTTGATSQTDQHPYAIRFFQRIFRYCHTAAQLNKALTTLEHRVTPTELQCLSDEFYRGQLIPSESATKFQTAVSNWLKEMNDMMLASGKQKPEPFISRRIAPNVTLFSGPVSSTNKTLLICFPPRGARHLTIPNAVLMQHTNSARFDLLIICESLNKSYRHGSLPFGKDLTEVSEFLKKQDFIHEYKSLRTLGYSAGAYPAVVVGSHLNAELALSIGGRLHRKRFILKNLDKVMTTWKAVRKRHRSRLLISYAADQSRDKKYAGIISKITDSSKVVVENKNGKIGHMILQRLLEQGELASYLSNTVFAEIDDDRIANTQADIIISFSSD